MKHIRKAAGLQSKGSDSSLLRILHSEDYYMRKSRRKGVLTEKDIKLRLQFAKTAQKKLAPEIWCKDIAFYLDGAGFTYKRNPCDYARRQHNKTWRKRKEGLSLHCTTNNNINTLIHDANN